MLYSQPESAFRNLYERNKNRTGAHLARGKNYKKKLFLWEPLAASLRIGAVIVASSQSEGGQPANLSHLSWGLQ
jgi:hypothetical protein